MDDNTEWETPRRLTQWNRYVPLVLTLFAGVGFSLAIFVAVRARETRNIHAQLLRAGDNRSWALKRAIEDNQLMLESIGSFFKASNLVERRGFSEFVRPFLLRKPGLQALAWVPCVSDSQRAEFKAFPVYFIEPFQGNEAMIGFDMASNPECFSALERACDTGQMTATEQIPLVEEPGQGSGFLIFLPIYKRGAPTGSVQNRRKGLQGFVVGVFRLADLVDRALAYLRPEDIDVYVLDKSAPAGERLLNFHPARTRTQRRQPASESELYGRKGRKGIHQVTTIELGGRQWSIVCTSPPDLVAMNRTSYPWVVLVSGLTFTGLLAAYFFTSISRTAHIELLIDELQNEVSERKRAEQELKDYAVALETANKSLEQFNAAAEAATQAKSEFLANMSHEIRTPMTAILGFTDMLLGSLSEPEDIEAAKTIKRNGEYLLGIINDILDLSKIEAGKLKVERIPCSPCQIIADVASLMRVRADAKGLPLTVEYDGPIPQTIATDPTRLRQILINLAGNAIKFTETGNVRILVRLARNDGQEPKLEFDIIDTGLGMTEEQIDKLFHRFTQADSSMTRKFGGTGLGLTISKRLTEMLGGDIMVTSQPEKGSTFQATIATGPLDGVPMLDHPEEVVIRDNKPDRTAPKPQIKLDCRILLAEDGPDNQRLISFILKKAGAEVTIAENGQEALEKALATYPGWGKRYGDPTEPFDLILMDIQMPVMDGYEATRRIRQEGFKGPIIALSAHAMSHAIRECLDAGCNDYAAKPVNRDKLLGIIAKHVDSSRRESSSQACSADRP